MKSICHPHAAAKPLKIKTDLSQSVHEYLIRTSQRTVFSSQGEISINVDTEKQGLYKCNE